MADNVLLNAGTGGDTIAADDVAGVKYQVVKVAVGADGAASLVSNSNPVPVSDAGGTITVDGTVAAIQSGTWDVGTVTTVSAVTAISNALPAGTNNIGDVDVLSIVPGTGASNLGKAEDAAHTSADVGVMALAVRRDADTTLVDTTGDYAPLQVNASGSLKVAITSGAGSGGTSIADGASFTRDSTSVTPIGAVVETAAPTLTNGDAAGLSMTTAGAVRVAVASGGITGAVVDSVAGATDEGVLSVVVRDDALATLTPVDGDYTQMRTNARGALWVALDSTAAQTVTLAAGTATNEIVGDVAQDAAVGGNPVLVGLRASTATPSAMSADGDSVYAWADRTGAQVVVGNVLDDAAFTPGTNRVTPVGYLADETATDSVDEGDIGAGRITLDRKQIMVPYAHAAGGATPGRLVSAASTNGTVVKASAGTLYTLIVTNLNAAVRYLKVYNSTSVTVGTTTPTWTFAIPASTTGAGFNVPIPACGIAFGTGICLGMTTGVADNDTGAVAANEIIANYAYI